MPTTGHRSRNGCWTCKTAKRKCDTRRPSCEACQKRGLECEGYEVRLRWGSGIASRGRFAGADKPINESILDRPKGRQRDLERERNREQLQLLEAKHEVLSSCSGPTSDTGGDISSPSDMSQQWAACSTSPEAQFNVLPAARQGQQNRDQMLFHEFLTRGINVLHSITLSEVPLVSVVPRLCEESIALYKICIAIQCSLPVPNDEFIDYYRDGLARFRLELSESSVVGLKDSNILAGLFLCTIELMRGAPWTVHLQGMHKIMQSHPPCPLETPIPGFRTHLMEVMGIMDLSVFSLGRRTPHFGVWRRHRASVRSNADFDEAKVEVVTGLPHTLIDLLDGIGESTSELDLWNWPGQKGSLLQSQLWESHRLAGMLNVRRHLRQARKTAGNEAEHHLPSNEILVLRILSCVDAIILAHTTSQDFGACIVNAIHYPVFNSGLELEVLRDNPEYRDRIIQDLNVTRKSPHRAIPISLQTVLEEYWKIGNDNLDVHELARSMGIETALF